MKAFLMYKNKDFDIQRKLPANVQELTQDLELYIPFGAMSHDDKFLFEVARTSVLGSEKDLDTIAYRQAILKDCLLSSVPCQAYLEISVESIESEKKH